MTAQEIKDCIGWGAKPGLRQQVMDLCDVVAAQGAEIRALKLVVTELVKRVELRNIDD